MLCDIFRKRYMESLGFYKHFYDDIHEYGSQESARKVFYFVPGISGVPGQIRFIFPSLFNRYGANMYVRCCYLPEFSATKPMWEKYTVENVDKKRDAIVEDLSALLSAHGDVTVIASSNGFYDFLHAYDELNDARAGKRLTLLWGACAPDCLKETLWEPFFYRMNGFVHNEYRWIAYPNHNLLKFLNPETTTTFKWRYESQKKTFFKIDLESRFMCFNLYWDYISVSCFNEMLGHMLRNVRKPIDVETRVLVAANDGYWRGRREDEIMAVIDKYVSKKTVTFKNASHLWVVAPENVTELLA